MPFFKDGSGVFAQGKSELMFLLMFGQTAVAVGVEPENKLPYNEYYEYFGPDYTLHIEPSNMENQNSPKDLEKMRYQCSLYYILVSSITLCAIHNGYAE